jgi:hypothetical protein
MIPIVFNILAWEKELEMRRERKPDGYYYPGDPDVEIMPGKGRSSSRIIPWNRPSTAENCIPVNPVRECACAD